MTVLHILQYGSTTHRSLRQYRTSRSERVGRQPAYATSVPDIAYQARRQIGAVPVMPPCRKRVFPKTYPIWPVAA
eukprot:3436253-Rhodomonas_salina.1